MNCSFSVVAFITLHTGQAAAAAAYESLVAPIAVAHGGRLRQQLMLDPLATRFDLIHVWLFPDEDSYRAFTEDPERQALAAARQAAIRETETLTGAAAAAFLSATPPTDTGLLALWRRYQEGLRNLAKQAGEAYGVFHLIPSSEWLAAQQSDLYRPASLQQEGYIHCSTREQVLDTAERFYAECHQLTVLCLNTQKLRPWLRYEAPSPALAGSVQSHFPHLYAPVSPQDVLWSAELIRSANGHFAWPESVSELA